MKFLNFIFLSCMAVIANAHADTKYPMPLIWDHNPSPELRALLWSKPAIKNDLDGIYADWVKLKCGQSDIDTCVTANPALNKNRFFDDIQVATPDLNNDGIRDLILYMGSDTGLMGSGRCAMTDVWFYENIGEDYRCIGKSGFVVLSEIALGAPKAKGKFRNIIYTVKNNACHNGKKNPVFVNKYDYTKRAYFEPLP